MGSEIKQIYFILAGEFVKIGIAKNPKKRLRDLQTANPVKLNLLYTIPGDETLEKTLHLIFDEYRESGEWFRYEYGLKSFIDCFRVNKYSIHGENLDIAPISSHDVINDDIDDVFKINGITATQNHCLVWEVLKEFEKNNDILFDESIDVGINKFTIIAVMAQDYQKSEGFTLSILKDLIEMGWIYRAKGGLYRVIIDKSEYKEEYEEVIKKREASRIDGEKINLMKKHILELEGEYGGRAPINVLIEIMEDNHNLCGEGTSNHIMYLKRRGIVYEPQKGYLRVA